MSTENKSLKRIGSKKIVAFVFLIISFIMAVYSTLDFMSFILEKKFIYHNNKLSFIRIFNDRVPVSLVYFPADLVFLPFWVTTYLLFSFGLGLIFLQMFQSEDESIAGFREFYKKRSILLTSAGFLIITVLIPYIIQLSVSNFYRIYTQFRAFLIVATIGSIEYVFMFLLFNFFIISFLKTESIKIKLTIPPILFISFIISLFFFTFLVILFLSSPSY